MSYGYLTLSAGEMIWLEKTHMSKKFQGTLISKTVKAGTSTPRVNKCTFFKRGLLNWKLRSLLQ